MEKHDSSEKVEIYIPKERKLEAEEIVKLIQELEPEEQKKLMVFLKGINFAKRLD